MDLRQKFQQNFPDHAVDESFKNIPVGSLEWARFLTAITSHLSAGNKETFIRKAILENNFEEMNFIDLERLIHELG